MYYKISSSSYSGGELACVFTQNHYKNDTVLRVNFDLIRRGGYFIVWRVKAILALY
jgi:hypothetical protein